MAFIRVEPVQVQVRTDWFSGRPREITWGDERLPITRLAVVREEAAAYPVISGPRTLFEVETPRARLSPDLPAPLAALDGDRPRRARSSAGGLTSNAPRRRADWGSRVDRPVRGPPLAGPTSDRGGRAGTAPAPIRVGTSERARRYRARSVPGALADAPRRRSAPVGWRTSAPCVATVQSRRWIPRPTSASAI